MALILDSEALSALLRQYQVTAGRGACRKGLGRADNAVVSCAMSPSIPLPIQVETFVEILGEVDGGDPLGADVAPAGGRL